MNPLLFVLHGLSLHSCTTTTLSTCVTARCNLLFTVLPASHVTSAAEWEWHIQIGEGGVHYFWKGSCGSANLFLSCSGRYAAHMYFWAFLFSSALLARRVCLYAERKVVPGGSLCPCWQPNTHVRTIGLLCAQSCVSWKEDQMDTVIHELLKHMNLVFLFTQNSLCVFWKVFGWSSMKEVIICVSKHNRISFISIFFYHLG